MISAVGPRWQILQYGARTSPCQKYLLQKRDKNSNVER